jgi:2-polyprenyl-3-methyl-5-hydroxy-6-metoxy-1,4-benzoquinol methylase
LKRIERINHNLISDVISSVNHSEDIELADQAEMAIPSYLNKSRLVRSIFWRRYDRVFRMTRLQPEMQVCEFGCGIGVFLPTLARETSKVFAIDLFPQYAQLLSKELDLEVTFVDSISKLPDESMDLIFAIEVMEHLEHPGEVTRAFSQKLKPGGKLIVSSPTETPLYKFGRFLVGYNKYHEYHKQNAFQLREIILENGFILQKTIRYPSPLLPLNLIFQFQVEQ